ncbi:MAG: cation transporter [Gammaproteobacteria bacterium]|nr:cation transporter [Gammaproteobacteria bacterium]
MTNNCQPNFKQDNDKNQRSLAFALLLTFGYSIVEAVVGYISGSLALLSDAGHMLTDATALLLALLAGIFMRRPPSKKHSYGFARIEVVAAMINAVFMLIVIAAIVYEAVDRIWNHTNVDGSSVFIVATIGLLINLIVAFKLSSASHGHGHTNLNTRAALVHVLGDLLGSVAAILAGAIIYLTGWMPIDPILSMLICVIVLRSVYHLLKESFLVLMEGVPEHIDLIQVSKFLNSIPSVTNISDLHVWNLSSGYIALSAHIKVDDLQAWPEVLKQAKAGLSDGYGIEHITIQPEV